MNFAPAEIRATILEGLHQIAPEADLEMLSDETNLRRELEIDSFDFLRLLVFLNERLIVEFPEADYGQLTSVRKLVEFISGKLPSADGMDVDGTPHS